MTYARALSLILFLALGSPPAPAGELRARVEIDPSFAEWTAERYLTARPMDPLRVSRVARDPAETRRAGRAGERMRQGAPRPPASAVAPRFDEYVHDPGARPRFVASRRRAAAPAPQDLAATGPDVLANRGTAGLDFSSSRLVPSDARVVYPYSTVGKLFFDSANGESFYCSASVIQRRLILTAGHCVYTPGEGWHRNFRFVPAFHKGNAPFGTWSVSTSWTTSEWFDGGNLYPNSNDFGLLVARDDLEGQAIGQVTGWLGWMTGRLTPNHIHMLGYPSNLDRGDELHQVASGGFDCCFTNTAIFGSDMRQGSSGGPWVQNFGVRARRQNVGKNKKPNRVVGVYSWLYVDNKRIQIAGSSIPGGSFADLIAAACDDATDNCT